MTTVSLTLKFHNNRVEETYKDVGLPFAIINAQSHLMAHEGNYCLLDSGNSLTLLTKPIDLANL